MIKIIAIIAVIWALVTMYLYFQLDSSLDKITLLETQKNSLNEELEASNEKIKSYNASQLAASKQIAELKKAAMASPDDCYTKSIDDSILSVLRNGKKGSNGKTDNNL